MNLVCLMVDDLKLVPYESEHDQQTVCWLNSPDLKETFGSNRTVTLESHRLWVENSRDILIWAILDKTLAHKGNVLLHCMWRHRSAYFQIYIGDSQFRGRGTGSRVLRIILQYAFADLGLHRIWLHTLAGNTRAELMYQHAGFALEGCEREAILRDGVFHSQSRWSLLAHDWRAKTNLTKI